MAKKRVIMQESKIKVGEAYEITGKQHTKLVEHIVSRMELSKRVRDTQIPIYEYIDKEYYGYLKLDADDTKRDRENKLGIGLKPVDTKLSLLFSQLDEVQTFLLTLLAPDEAIYSAMAPVEQQPIADGFAALMNDHARQFKHFRHLALFILACIRYNFGAFGVNWREQQGQLIRNLPDGSGKVVKGVVYRGNELLAYNPYQLSIDGSVNPIDLAEIGEYFAYTEILTPFRIKKMAQDRELFNTERFLACQDVLRWYRPMPEIRGTNYQGIGGPVDWVSIISAGAQAAAKDSAEGKEVTMFVCWLAPSQFGLSKSKEYEIWRFFIGGGTHILRAEPLTNAHGMLPINIAIPFEDHFGLRAKGPSERLIPYQTFASHQLNVHQRAARKKLYGLSVYNENVFPLLKNTAEDLAGGKIPATPQGPDFDIRKHFAQFTDGPDTSKTMENIALANQLMQVIMPTQVLQQVAGLERATQYQAAALVQGFNKRNLKIGKIINSQAMDRGRFMQMYNIYEYQDSCQILSNEGQLLTINPREFRDTRIEFTVGDGLKGLDRLALIMHYKELFNSVLQSQQAVAQVDVLKWMNYLSSLFGDHTDFSQFKLVSPIDALPPDQRDLAYRLLQQFVAQQQAGGAGQGGAAPAGILPG